ncbi:MAG: hypothetical protein Q8L21_00945 [Candidatus Komeilibacteria bacterium]|nr:hypothetical protein [Candidatus Komeilibacteria bacterium]
MAILSPIDARTITDLRRANVLQDVAGHLLDQRQGVLLVTCPDGDHFFDIFSHQLHMQDGQCRHPRVHTFGWHGGALRLVPGSPANTEPEEHQIFMREIREGRALKGINTVALYAHVPCGKAGERQIDLLQLMVLLIQAKAIIKLMNNGIVVAPFLHVAYQNNRRRTYFVSRPEWDKWLDTTP